MRLEGEWRADYKPKEKLEWWQKYLILTFVLLGIYITLWAIPVVNHDALHSEKPKEVKHELLATIENVQFWSAGDYAYLVEIDETP